MTRLMIVGMACLMLSACSGGQGEAEMAQDSLSRRQRDSIVGASRLPGSRGVQRAIRAGDAAEARRAALDSILR